MASWKKQLRNSFLESKRTFVHSYSFGFDIDRTKKDEELLLHSLYISLSLTCFCCILLTCSFCMFVLFLDDYFSR